MHGVTALPPDSPQVAPSQPPQHKPSPNNNILPPKPAHLAAQVAAAATSFRQIKPPMPSPPLSSLPTSKADQEVRLYTHCTETCTEQTHTVQDTDCASNVFFFFSFYRISHTLTSFFIHPLSRLHTF